VTSAGWLPIGSLESFFFKKKKMSGGWVFFAEVCPEAGGGRGGYLPTASFPACLHHPGHQLPLDIVSPIERSCPGIWKEANLSCTSRCNTA
jgi:hypothetical protein